MGKRSQFVHVDLDFYPTPYEATRLLLYHLPSEIAFIEPCAGDGRLIDQLQCFGHRCVEAWDVAPSRDDIVRADARTKMTGTRCDYFITNPPWNRAIMHAIIDNLLRQAPVWLLIDADWMHTVQAAPYMKWLRKIVSVGRLKWMPNSASVGKDNCAWYLFDQHANGATLFYGRCSIAEAAE